MNGVKIASQRRKFQSKAASQTNLTLFNVFCKHKPPKQKKIVEKYGTKNFPPHKKILDALFAFLRAKSAICAHFF